MPRTNKPFDWEVYDEDGEFLDILSMTRNDVKDYKKSHPGYMLKEIGYTDDGGNDSWDTNSKKDWDLYSVRIRGRR